MKILLLILMIGIGIVSKASIVYVDINPDNTFTSGGNIDFNNDGTVELSTTDGVYFGTPVFYFLPNGDATAEWDVPKPLPLNDTIGVSSNWYQYASDCSMNNWGQGTYFPLNQDAFMGIKFTISGNTHYGWVRIMWNGTNFIYKDYAYENVPNALILAGDKKVVVGEGSYDISMDYIYMDSVLVKGNILIKGRIKNMRSNAVDSFDVVYKIDNENYTSVFKVVANQSILFNQTYDFTCNIPWVVNDLGKHTVKIKVSNPNGNADINKANNSKSKEVLILYEKYTKTVVCEEVGGTWCMFCPRGLVGLNTMAHEYPDSLWIGIAVHVHGRCHSQYKEEPMLFSDYADKILNKVNRRVPSGIIDRNTGSVVSMAIQSLRGQYLKHKRELPVVKIKITNQQWNNDNRNFTVETTSKFAYDINSANYRVALVVMEDEVTGTDIEWAQHDHYQGTSETMVDWDGFNFNTLGTLKIENSYYVPASLMHYNHVARQLIGGWEGVANSIPATVMHNTPYKYTFNGSIPDTLDANNINFVALLIDSSTGKIVNANKMKLNVADNVSNKIINNIKIYPNPSNGTFNIKNAQGCQIIIYNIIGQKVYENVITQTIKTIDLSYINNVGNYIVKIRNNNTILTKQIIILK